MPDPINDVADDWKLASLVGLAGARGGGAAMLFFAIKSDRLNSLEPMVFCASGLGMGGNASGVSYETFSNAMQRGSLAFSDISVVTPFSIRMLHTSAGLYGSAGLGIPVANFGWSYLDAGRDGVKFFTSSGAGAAVGSGTGALAMAGIWYSYKLNGNSINPIPAYQKSLMDSIEQFIGEMDRGIRNIYYPRF
jgi:hypothetical protein